MAITTPFILMAALRPTPTKPVASIVSPGPETKAISLLERDGTPEVPGRIP